MEKFRVSALVKSQERFIQEEGKIARTDKRLTEINSGQVLDADGSEVANFWQNDGGTLSVNFNAGNADKAEIIASIDQFISAAKGGVEA